MAEVIGFVPAVITNDDVKPALVMVYERVGHDQWLRPIYHPYTREIAPGAILRDVYVPATF